VRVQKTTGRKGMIYNINNGEIYCEKKEGGTENRLITKPGKERLGCLCKQGGFGKKNWEKSTLGLDRDAESFKIER